MRRLPVPLPAPPLALSPAERRAPLLVAAASPAGFAAGTASGPAAGAAGGFGSRGDAGTAASDPAAGLAYPAPGMGNKGDGPAACIQGPPCVDYDDPYHRGCGTRGGPGCRKDNGHCAAWRDGFGGIDGSRRGSKHAAAFAPVWHSGRKSTYQSGTAARFRVLESRADSWFRQAGEPRKLRCCSAGSSAWTRSHPIR